MPPKEYPSFLGAKFSFPSMLVLINCCFAAIAVIGQVGQNVSLPLWTGATGALGNPNCTSNNSDFKYQDKFLVGDTDSGAPSKNVSTYQPTMDPFFVLSFASLSFVVIFGVITSVLALVQIVVNRFNGDQSVKWITVKDDLAFPQWQFVLIGIFDALNGVFVVFASLPSRTAPFLQAILGNFTIPLTIFFRYK